MVKQNGRQGMLSVKGMIVIPIAFDHLYNTTITGFDCGWFYELMNYSISY